LYDFWYLTEVVQIDLAEHLYEFQNKAHHKNQNPKKIMEKVMSKETVFKRDWNKKLASQIHNLPEFEKVFRETKRNLKLLT